MFKIMDTNEMPNISSNVRDYISTLSPGVHSFMTPSDADISVVGQPSTGRGFLYICLKTANTAVCWATKYYLGSPYVYMTKMYQGSWDEWHCINPST